MTAVTPASSLRLQKIEAGDSVWVVAAKRLAQEFGRPPTNGEINAYKQQIIDHNGLKPPYTILRGADLEVPAYRAAKTPESAESVAEPAVSVPDDFQPERATSLGAELKDRIGEPSQRSVDALERYLHSRRDRTASAAIDGPQSPGLTEPEQQVFTAATQIEKVIRETKSTYGLSHLVEFSKQLHQLRPEVRRAVAIQCPELMKQIEPAEAEAKRAAEMVVPGGVPLSPSERQVFLSTTDMERIIRETKSEYGPSHLTDLSKELAKLRPEVRAAIANACPELMKQMNAAVEGNKASFAGQARRW